MPSKLYTRTNCDPETELLLFPMFRPVRLGGGGGVRRLRARGLTRRGSGGLWPYDILSPFCVADVDSATSLSRQTAR